MYKNPHTTPADAALGPPAAGFAAFLAAELDGGVLVAPSLTAQAAASIAVSTLAAPPASPAPRSFSHVHLSTAAPPEAPAAAGPDCDDAAAALPY